jgi:protein tyrosine phosphatase
MSMHGQREYGVLVHLVGRTGGFIRLITIRRLHGISEVLSAVERVDDVMAWLVEPLSLFYS